MASYNSGFDAPPRPAQTMDPRSRRLGTYIPERERQESREEEIRRMNPRAHTHPVPRLQPTLPNSNVRPHSPTRAMTEPKVGTGSRFGFGRPSAATPQRPELKGKSSRNVLRRKPSSIAQLGVPTRPLADRAGSTSPSKWQPSAENRPSIEASLKSAEAYNEIFTRTRTKNPITESPPIIPELDRYRTRPDQGKVIPHKLSTTDLPPPTPFLSGTPLYSGSSGSHHRYSGYSGSGYSASPSTRFSESPGPGAAYSRDTTPTSMSSQSPGIIAPLKPITPRLRQGSPAFTRPPVTRRRAVSNANETEGTTIDPHGLPSLRESLTSSSSNSTVKGERKAEEKKEKKKKKRLSPLPPSPPPRKSSQKFKKPRSDVHESPSKQSQAPAKAVMTSPVKVMPTKILLPTPAAQKSIPPTRPSREGAPDLQSAGESIAVIQSNLAGLTFSSDRRQSGLPRVSHSPQPQFAQRSMQGSRLPSRNPSPTFIQPSPRLGTPAPAGLGIIPDLRPVDQPKQSGLRTPSPSTSNPKTRFGIFGRRTKTAPEVPTVESVKEKNTLRKGPAAGTGHEGYGRHGFRGRSTSAGGLGRGRERSISAASSSQESVSSTRTHDPFLLERMSPVIIAGGEVIENRNRSSELYRTESNTSLLLGRPSLESRGSSKSSLAHEVPRTTLWPSAFPKDVANRSSMRITPGRRPSDSSDDGMAKSSLAFRRSIQRLNTSNTALNLPKPLNIPSGPGASLSSLDASIMSDESQQEIIEAGRGRQITKTKKLEKRPRSPRKWNFFHRAQPKVESKLDTSVAVTVGRAPVKPIPHYALMDSSDEIPDHMEGVDLEDILRDAEVIDLSNEELDILQFGEMQKNLKRERDDKIKAAKAKEEKLPGLLFSSPESINIKADLPKTDLHLTKVEAPIRPSRLPQVGRIPKVVSARPQATSPKSFSRPFARLSAIQPLLCPVTLDKESIALGASPPKSTIEPPRMDLQVALEAQSRKNSTDSRIDVSASTDFLAFSPHRKGSEATTSSSGCVSFVGTTAIIPEVNADLVEDEVWDEYDDLIVNEDIKVPISATSSHGLPFQYESYETRQMRKSRQPKESPTLASAPRIQPNDLPRTSILTTSSVYSNDMSPRLKDSLAALPTPTTPLSFTDFFSAYGDRNNSVHEDSAKKLLRGSRSSSRKSISSSHSRTHSGLVTISEQENADTPVSQVNLRVGSMTVSKWLTFGQVLFSPAREAIEESDKSSGPSKRHSVLVIDGLGNDDWSFYAAETYPSATFYNLSPTAPVSSSTSVQKSALPISPPNHRQVQHPPLHTNTKFPFPSTTFNLVVLRFPPSLPLSTYTHLLSEAKRVLAPGGYLELAVLDIDMNNMGPRARRAVRALKMRMQSSGGQNELWTGSACDTMLKGVGRRGFVGVKSCVVGVPVVSIPVTDSISQNHQQAGTSTEKSLADLMRIPSTPSSDESITNMVAKVGRWWFERCYESDLDITGAGSGSIFEDPEILRESQEWGSSFKLLVAYARKPVSARRRTLSA